MLQTTRKTTSYRRPESWFERNSLHDDDYDMYFNLDKCQKGRSLINNVFIVHISYRFEIMMKQCFGIETFYLLTFSFFHSTITQM